MEDYNPSQTPPPEEWLELDELSRISMVLEYHEATGAEMDEEAMNLHSMLHVVVENQLAANVVPVPATMARLIRQGLSRHEAIHAIAGVLAEDLFDILKNKREFDAKRYRIRLNKLTAKRWRKRKW